jgi:transglutaminase-like putative cysteine protease
MQLAIRHELSFQYEPPAKTVAQILRVHPRDHHGQHILNWRVEVDADCSVIAREDTFGNMAHSFAMSALHKWVVRIEGVVETADVAGVVQGARERFPTDLYVRETELTSVSPLMRDYIAPLQALRGQDLPLLHRLLGLVHSRFDGFSAHDDLTRPAHRAFELSTCSIADSAHVFIGCARHMGIPARYISGYLGPSTFHGEARTHVWAECYVTGLGWVGFDPVFNLCPQDKHVRVAMGLDALSGSALRSAVASGSGESVTSALYMKQHQAQSQS